MSSVDFAALLDYIETKNVEVLTLSQSLTKYPNV